MYLMFYKYSVLIFVDYFELFFYLIEKISVKIPKSIKIQIFRVFLH